MLVCFSLCTLQERLLHWCPAEFQSSSSCSCLLLVLLLLLLLQVAARQRRLPQGPGRAQQRPGAAAPVQVGGCRDVWKSDTGCTEDCRRIRYHMSDRGAGGEPKLDQHQYRWGGGCKYQPVIPAQLNQTKLKRAEHR